MKTAPLLSLLFFCACASLPEGSPDFRVALDVVDLKEEERLLLQEGVCSLPGVRECEMSILEEIPPEPPKRRRGKRGPPEPVVKNPTPPVRISFMYKGELNGLRADLGQLPHPGLEPSQADANLSFRGFDNLAPRLKLLSPREDAAMVTRLPIAVEVEVLGKDVAQVTIMGVEATHTISGPWRAEIEPKDGEHWHVITATDESGNSREISFVTRVDTTPPTLELNVEKIDDANAKVTGKLIDGLSLEIDAREVGLKMFGGFEANVKMDPDKRTVIIKAVDEHGNKVTEVWSLDTGEQLSRD